MLRFPLDVAIRRLGLERGDFARAWEWLRSRGRPREREFAATPELARLKTVKERTLATAPVLLSPTTTIENRKSKIENPEPPTPNAQRLTPPAPESQRPNDPTTQ